MAPKKEKLPSAQKTSNLSKEDRKAIQKQNREANKKMGIPSTPPTSRVK